MSLPYTEDEPYGAEIEDDCYQGEERYYDDYYHDGNGSHDRGDQDQQVEFFVDDFENYLGTKAQTNGGEKANVGNGAGSIGLTEAIDYVWPEEPNTVEKACCRIAGLLLIGHKHRKNNNQAPLSVVRKAIVDDANIDIDESQVQELLCITWRSCFSSTNRSRKGKGFILIKFHSKHVMKIAQLRQSEQTARGSRCHRDGAELSMLSIDDYNRRLGHTAGRQQLQPAQFAPGVLVVDIVEGETPLPDIKHAIGHLSKVQEVFFHCVASCLNPKSSNSRALRLLLFAPDHPPNFQATVYVIHFCADDPVRDKPLQFRLLSYKYILETNNDECIERGTASTQLQQVDEVQSADGAVGSDSGQWQEHSSQAPSLQKQQLQQLKYSQQQRTWQSQEQQSPRYQPQYLQQSSVDALHDLRCTLRTVLQNGPDDRPRGPIKTMLGAYDQVRFLSQLFEQPSQQASSSQRQQQGDGLLVKPVFDIEQMMGSVIHASQESVGIQGISDYMFGPLRLLTSITDQKELHGKIGTVDRQRYDVSKNRVLTYVKQIQLDELRCLLEVPVFGNHKALHQLKTSLFYANAMLQMKKLSGDVCKWLSELPDKGVQ